jgi:hypothetical protein
MLNLARRWPLPKVLALLLPPPTPPRTIRRRWGFRAQTTGGCQLLLVLQLVTLVQEQGMLSILLCVHELTDDHCG